MRTRRAYICEHKEHEGNAKRVFLTPEDPEDFVPVCHGRQMKRQPNVRYKGTRPLRTR